MGRKNLQTRNQLVKAATRVVHRQGFHRTTLADIAREAKFPLGNLYYYFKTKEDICAAILDGYRVELGACFSAWEQLADPRSRLQAFADMIAGMRGIAAKCGCPFGSLATELSKERAPLSEAAAGLFRASLRWLELQFRALGKGRASKNLALHVVTVWQGALLLTHAFGDPEVASTEVRQLKGWMREQT